MRSSAQFPAPVPPATPATSAVTIGGLSGQFTPKNLPGIFTTTAGVLTPTNSQKRKVIGA